MLLFISALCALAFFLGAVALLVYGRHLRRRNLLYRLRYYQLEEVSGGGGVPLLQQLRGMLTRLARPIAERGPVQALDLRMRQADIPLLGGEFLVLLGLVFLAVFLALWMLTLDSTMALLGGSLGASALWGGVLFRVQKRKNSFFEQLGDSLNTISNALRAGYSFQQAMDVVAKEMEPPISQEFAQVAREVNMSVPLDVALEAMNRRVGSRDFDLVVTAVLIHREVGGNLAQILDTISDTLGERIRMKREINSLTAQGRLSATILVAMPFVIGLFLYVFKEEQIMLLFTEPVGRMALALSLVLEVIGIFVIRRIVDIET